MAIYTVINTGNKGAGSLRRAINQANSNPGADTIEFDSGLSGATIVLSTRELIVPMTSRLTGWGPTN